MLLTERLDKMKRKKYRQKYFGSGNFDFSQLKKKFDEYMKREVSEQIEVEITPDHKKSDMLRLSPKKLSLRKQKFKDEKDSGNSFSSNYFK